MYDTIRPCQTSASFHFFFCRAHFILVEPNHDKRGDRLRSHRLLHCVQLHLHLVLAGVIARKLGGRQIRNNAAPAAGDPQGQERKQKKFVLHFHTAGGLHSSIGL